MTTTKKTSVDHATHASGKRSSEHAASADHALTDANNRSATESDEDPQALAPAQWRDKPGKSERGKSERKPERPTTPFWPP